MQTLLLTHDEQALYKGLSAELQTASVQDETIDAFESNDELALRYQMATFDRDPSVKNLLQYVREGKYDQVDLESISPEILPDLYFTMGARGLSALAQSVLSTANSAEDLEQLEAITLIRHEILLANSRS